MSNQYAMQDPTTQYTKAGLEFQQATRRAGASEYNESST